MFPLVAPGVHPPHGPLGDPAVGTWPLAECVRCAFSSAYAKSRSARFPLRSEHQYWHCLPACLRRRTQSLVLLGHLISSPLVCVAGGVPGPTPCVGYQSCPRWSASVWKWSCLLPPPRHLHGQAQAGACKGAVVEWAHVVLGSMLVVAYTVPEGGSGGTASSAPCPVH